MSIVSEQNNSSTPWRCHGHTIANQSNQSFLEGTGSLWLPLVIEASINMCRQPGNSRVYCIFSTSRPIVAVRQQGIGMPDGQAWPANPDGEFIGGEGFTAPAIPATIAESMGLLPFGSAAEFRMPTQKLDENSTRAAITTGSVTTEQMRSASQRRESDARKKSDDSAEVDAFLGDLKTSALDVSGDISGYASTVWSAAGSALGWTTGKVASGVGFVLGEAAGLAFSALGPIGIAGVVVAGAVAYKVVIAPKL